MNNNTIKCSHCKKVCFDYEQEKCPFCHKNLKNNIFDDMFGEDNPFDSFGRT
jgi:hypothetical protein